MLKFFTKLDTSVESDLSLTLPYDSRKKARLYTRLDNGLEAGLFLPRGHTLRGGEQIKAETGEIVTIISASEEVSTVFSDNRYLLMRACYHLGNRHIPLEIQPDFIRFQHDHVLNKMLEHLDLQVVHEYAPFEPESGAYAHHHSHSHQHAHE